MDRATAQKISLGFGIVYLLVAILGFIPGITQSSMVTNDTMGMQQGLLLGIFGVNLVHNLSHVLFAAILIFGGLNPDYVRPANRVLAVVFAIVVLGQALPFITNGLALNVPDLILHIGSLLITAYLGWGVRDAYTRNTTTTATM